MILYLLSRYMQPKGLWQRRWGFSKRPGFLDHKLLPAKVGSSAHQKHQQKKPPRPKDVILGARRGGALGSLPTFPPYRPNPPHPTPPPLPLKPVRAASPPPPRPPAVVGGSSGREASPRCLHPLASPRAAFFFGQALACPKWCPLQFAHFGTVCRHQ